MYVVFDIETTGLSTTHDDIIQFSYCMFDNNSNLVKAETLYYYYEKMCWSEEAYNIHHISQDYLKQHADKFEENLVKMYSILQYNNICGHNVKSFDAIFCRNWLSRFGLPTLQYRVVQDTMLMFRPMTKRPRIKLIKLQEMLGISDDTVNSMRDMWFNGGITTDAMTSHNAEWDTTLTAIITLIGINKGYCNFDKPSPASVEAPDFDSFDFTEGIAHLADTIFLKLTDTDAVALNIGKGIAETVYDLDDLNGKETVIPALFTKLENVDNLKALSQNVTEYPTYICTHKGVNFIYVDNRDEPEFYVYTDASVLPAEAMVHLPKIIKDTFYKEF